MLVPVAVIIIFGLRRTGYGRLLYAVGDNPIAARLAGVRVWQVLLVLYVISGLLAGIAGIVFAGVTKTAAPGVRQTRTCCHRWRPPSSAARPSSVVVEATRAASSAPSS